MTDKFRLTRSGNVNLIESIKALRNYTSFGLKEAKDIIEASTGEGCTFEADISKEKVLTLKILLKSFGCILEKKGLSNEFVNHREVLKHMMKEAIDENEMELVKDLMQLIEKHF